MVKRSKYVICAYRPWNLEYFKHDTLFSNPITLSADLAEINPEWVFFLDWSWKVPESVWKRYKCVVFHESYLPHFRGGSPIQNQISRGVKKTKLTALLMDGGIDTGDILLQEELDLSGHLWEIMDGVVHLSDKMIDKILSGDFKQEKQGEGTYFKRRTPEESEINPLWSLDKIYDHIRMLEDPYPNAFLKVGDKKIIFKSADMGQKLTATVEIS